jgi:hypothetical protein
MKRKIKNKLLPLLLAPLFFLGCTLAEVNVDVVSQRTALENQVLGTYNSLDKELLLAASVRGVDPKGNIEAPPQKSGEARRAREAMEVLSFNKDDINRLKRLLWVGETNTGFLTARPKEGLETPEELKEYATNLSLEEFDSIIIQVNKARKVLMERVINLNDDLGEKDLVRVGKVFAKLNRQKAVKGDLIEGEGGKWSRAK